MAILSERDSNDQDTALESLNISQENDFEQASFLFTVIRNNLLTWPLQEDEKHVTEGVATAEAVEAEAPGTVRLLMFSHAGALIQCLNYRFMFKKS